jgi:thiosulfate/3-mercaptopyruvate sulfurtransferase
MSPSQLVSALALLTSAMTHAIAATPAASAADESFHYTTMAGGEIVIDSRPLAECTRASLPAARCLPADDFFGPHRRLPSERDLLWLLGTAGLDGSESVLVVGQDAIARDFVGGLLYLAGQRQVRVLSEPIGRLPGVRSPGQARDLVRSTVFTAPMRAELWVLRDELRQALAREAPQLLDGRTESEYWGETVRGTRGGHLPGAILFPANQVLPAPRSLAKPPADTIAYAHDAYEGIAYFTRLRAGQAMAARVYVAGWAEWSADGSLPVDAATYPARAPDFPTGTAKANPATATDTAINTAANAAGPAFAVAPKPAALVAALAALALAFAGGWLIARRKAT